MENKLLTFAQRVAAGEIMQDVDLELKRLAQGYVNLHNASVDFRNSVKDSGDFLNEDYFENWDSVVEALSESVWKFDVSLGGK